MRASLWRLLFIGCLTRCGGYNGDVAQGFCCLGALRPILEQWLTFEGIIPQKSNGEEVNLFRHPIQDASSAPIKQKAGIFLESIRPIVGNVIVITVCPSFGKFLVNGCYSLCLSMKACYNRCAFRLKSRKDCAMHFIDQQQPKQ